jgi:hypothetical protein
LVAIKLYTFPADALTTIAFVLAVLTLVYGKRILLAAGLKAAIPSRILQSVMFSPSLGFATTG